MHQPSPALQTVSGFELWQWRSAAQQAALAAQIPVAEVDWLLQQVASLDRLALRLETFKNLPEICLSLPLKDLDALWQKRIHERLPVQYIAGVTPWRNFELKVSPAVLIPRPETEILVDLAVLATKKSAYSLECGHWADLGTGSGAIALGLAQAMPHATIHAVDWSTDAIAVAQANAQKLGLTQHVQFYQGSWWQPLAALKGQFSGMVSNPPYIPHALILQLQPEVANHEPWLALDGGVDGLDCIRHLVRTAVDYLQPGGVWLIEMMAGQAEAVADLLQRSGYCNIEIHPDLAGIERFALAYRSDQG